MPLSFLADDRTDLMDPHETIDTLLIVCRQAMLASSPVDRHRDPSIAVGTVHLVVEEADVLQ